MLWRFPKLEVPLAVVVVSLDVFDISMFAMRDFDVEFEMGRTHFELRNCRTSEMLAMGNKIPKSELSRRINVPGDSVEGLLSVVVVARRIEASAQW